MIWIWSGLFVSILLGLAIALAVAARRQDDADDGEMAAEPVEHVGAEDDRDTAGFFAALHLMPDEPLDEEEREALAREREFVAAFDDIEKRCAAEVDRVVAQAMASAAANPAWAGILTGAWPVYREVAKAGA